MVKNNNECTNCQRSRDRELLEVGTITKVLFLISTSGAEQRLWGEEVQIKGVVLGHLIRHEGTKVSQQDWKGVWHKLLRVVDAKENNSTAEHDYQNHLGAHSLPPPSPTEQIRSLKAREAKRFGRLMWLAVADRNPQSLAP